MADFRNWSKENLVQLAEQLMAENTALHADRKMLLERVREQIRAQLPTSDEALRGTLNGGG